MRFKAITRSRLLLATSLVFVAPTAIEIMAPAAASAAASCNTSATGEWKSNCTVSEGDDSRYVVAIQMIVGGQEVCPGVSVDGDFGPATFKGVECYQKFFGLSVDGVVGPDTWNSMRNELSYYNTKDGYNYYYSTGVGDVDFRRTNSNDDWYYGGPDASSTWTRMNEDAP